MAGKVANPEEREYFEAMIRPRIDGSTVEFLGEADARMKRGLYRDARCLLVPIQWDEPFGLVMIEAMACGTPPVVFNRGAAPELIEDRVTGFLVADACEMAAAIGEAGGIDPYACRAQVETCYAPSAIANKYLDLYGKIIAAGTEREGDLE
jgi:glycosyltransferase involved in cell wall biosynthesis